MTFCWVLPVKIPLQTKRLTSLTRPIRQPLRAPNLYRFRYFLGGRVGKPKNGQKGVLQASSFVVAVSCCWCEELGDNENAAQEIAIVVKQ